MLRLKKLRNSLVYVKYKINTQVLLKLPDPITDYLINIKNKPLVVN